MRTFQVFLLSAGLLMLWGCGEKDEPPAPAEEAGSEVGAGDVIDYAVGKKQVEIMKESEEKLERIRQEHDRRLKEAMGE